MGITTAHDFAMRPASWVQATFKTVVIERTWAELNGTDCIADDLPTTKKSICTSRSFEGMVHDFETLRTHVANFAARGAEKLRKQQSAANVVGVFIDSNHFHPELAQYWNMTEATFHTPTSSTMDIVQGATACLHSIYRNDICYKRAGVVLMGVVPNTAIQPDLFTFNAERHEHITLLDHAVDKINRVEGTETVILSSQQYPNGKKFADAIKRDYKSACPTTRWTDIVKLK